MAMTKKSQNDYLTQSFGQNSETAQGGTYGLTVGGVYQSTQGSLTDGDWSALNVDDYGNLTVNVAAGEVVAVSAGTITTGTINKGTINTGTVDVVKVATITGGTVQEVSSLATAVGLGSVSNIAAIHNAGTLAALPDLPGGTIDNITNLDAGTITKVEGGTINVVGKYSSLAGTITIPTSDSVQSGTLANTANGVLRGVSINVPALEGTGTCTLNLVDTLGGTLVAITKDESTLTYSGTIVPMSTTMEWRAVANGTQSANATVTFEAHYEL